MVRSAGSGERLAFWGGGLIEMKTTSEETGGSLTLFEDRVEGGKTTPLHTHEHEDELLYVLEGSIAVHLDGERHELDPGGVAFAPRGAPHAFLVTSARARILTLLTPGSAEAFYREASEPAAEGSDSSSGVDFERVRAAAERVGGMTIVGPPPFAEAGAHARLSSESSA